MVVKSAQNKLPAAARQVSLLKNFVILKFLQNRSKNKFTRTEMEMLCFVIMVEHEGVLPLINASSIITVFNIVVPFQAGIQQSVLFYLAVFQVLPLSFIGMLEINKKVSNSSINCDLYCSCMRGIV